MLAELQPEPRYLEDDSVEERVVGGEVARPNSWPWQVLKHEFVHGDCSLQIAIYTTLISLCFQKIYGDSVCLVVAIMFPK